MANEDPLNQLNMMLDRWRQSVPPGEHTDELVVTLHDRHDKIVGTHHYTARQADALAGALANVSTRIGDARTIASLLSTWSPRTEEVAEARLVLANRSSTAGAEPGVKPLAQPRIAPLAGEQIAELASYLEISLARVAVDQFFLREARFPLASLVEVVPEATGAIAGQTGIVADITPLLPSHEQSDEVRFRYRVRLNLPGEPDTVRELEEHLLQLPTGRR